MSTLEFRAKDVSIEGHIRLSVSKTTYINLNEKGYDPNRILQKITLLKRFLIIKGKYEENIDIFTEYGTFGANIQEGEIFLKHFNRNSLEQQSRAMKHGICISVEKGIIVKIRLPEFGLFYDIYDGKVHFHNLLDKKNCKSGIEKIKYQLKKETEIGNDIVYKEEYKVHKKLDELLGIAENYAILGSEIEIETAQSVGRIPYYTIDAVDFDRIDRVAYEFKVDSFDESIYKVGVQVEIKDNNDCKQIGEIVEIVEGKDGIGVRILFNNQFSFNLLSKNGWISLSYSSVNKDVQLATIEKLRDGKAKATYLDNIIGKEKSQGFDNKNLKDVLKELQNKKYPPNKSQLDAIVSGINTKDIFLVMGPPGTGKTTVILEWVKYFVKEEGKRVLISSQNNKAVDNVIARIAEEKEIDILRIGSESRLQSEVIPFMFEKKISCLANEINEKTYSGEEKIKDICNKFNEFKNSLVKCMDLNYKANESKKDLVENIQNELIPLYYQLAELQKVSNDLLYKIKNIEGKIRGMENDIMKYEKLESKIRKVLFFLPYFIRKNIMKVLTEKYSTSINIQNKSSKEYNKLIVIYNNKVNKIADESGEIHRIALERRDTHRESITEVYPNANQEINLFNDFVINRDIYKDNDKIKGVYNYIENEEEKAQSIMKVLEEWREEAGGKQNYALKDIILESVDLVGATCIGVSSQKKFESLDFDVTIIDEAGQIQVHNALVPMGVSGKLIMLGDHKQIPPIVDQNLLEICEQNEIDTELLTKSLFEDMYKKVPEENKIMLDTQYRMPGEIADILSKEFYCEKYLSPDFKRGLGSLVKKVTDKSFLIIDTSEEENRAETPIENAGCENMIEAQAISLILEEILKNGECDTKEIGIISAYKSQVRLIKNVLNKHIQEDLLNEMVATLDSFQGQERDLIVYSFTKSSHKDSKQRRIGFLSELRRLNVAMSRCKKMLILIGDMKFLSSCEYVEIDDTGKEIDANNEKKFSSFIQNVLTSVKEGNGEIKTFKELKNTLTKGGEINGE